MDISFTEGLLASSSPQPYFLFPISTLQSSYWGLRLKLGSSSLSIIPSKEIHGPIYHLVDACTIPCSVPVFAVPPLTLLVRIESKLKTLAIVNAASSYDSEYRQAADLVRWMFFSPHTPFFFFSFYFLFFFFF